ncbi:glycosylphosphatidylinositol anchor biosynthesis [Cadophora gregata]|uniref:glycosylphosphatidylinositol anchor biosynthesis n=1 Tax=Cadophora gregata TaxID=51156 RepID=UPI0026DBB5D4|nr:glycosylphosphatidylinositol anchor biosynthesis [Cadophora gregata]KAK0109629.1 glycosylphosphatidylinositol anchor biosynthesis [Cadophora gregata]KAK0110741.1 glycosylphosphatidylinositol anchor biosynthesis [Cadophora gregata f. sp. sojae]
MSSSIKLNDGQKRMPDAKIENLPPKDNGLHHLVNEQSAKDAWILLLVFRCINALAVRTFFQPDEYFQSLEPAWQMAFGPQSGAWITWEWHHQLRSSLHPALFAIVYYAADKVMTFMALFPQFRAMILAVLPNLVQAYIAAVGDYYTWQLAERIYGTGTKVSSAVFWMTLFSPWQWFCSTRTFSNCLETTLTISALYFWPWAMSTGCILGRGSDVSQIEDEDAKPNSATSSGIFQTPRSVKHLRISLLLAGIACILRPTNGLIWFSILMPTVTNFFGTKSQASVSDYVILLREGIICGSIALLLSVASDRLYFGEWTFPPYQWLHFNISQDLAVFYGRNDWHYYISQGLPLLLTTYVPFTLVALYQASLLSSSNIRFLFTTTIFLTLGTLSLISHKEVRFIYPLLPLLHILTAPTISAFFEPEAAATSKAKTGSQPVLVASTSTVRRKSLCTIIFLNILIAGYTSFFHQTGVLSVTKFLREEYETLALDGRGRLLSDPDAGIDDEYKKSTTYTNDETFAGFLMPCHSTPWRSALIHPGLKAWALGCEPPIHLAPHTPERENYRDEADRFYDDSLKFLKEEINTKDRPWPRYIVGFEGIEKDLKTFYEGEMKGFMVKERWRTRNSHWHDDWRRTGDVVVWEFVDGSTQK